MQHLDEGTIHAWLDGQLPRDEAHQVEAHVAECRECADAVAEARGLIAASSRILTALDGVPGEVVPKQAPRRMLLCRWTWWYGGRRAGGSTERRWLRLRRSSWGSGRSQQCSDQALRLQPPQTQQRQLRQCQLCRRHPRLIR